MVILRCTSKLRKRLGIKLTETEHVSTNQMGDWSCNLIHVGRTQLILCVNHTTRLPIFIPAAPAKQFPDKLQATLKRILSELSVPAESVLEECTHYADFVITTTNNRSVLGSINDFGRLAMYRTSDLLALSLRLAEAPCSPLQYQSPDQAVRELFAS